MSTKTTTCLAAASLFLLGCASLGTTPAREPMTQARLEALVEEWGSRASGNPGAIEFEFEGIQMACLSDPAHDRMRIIAPVAPLNEVGLEQVARSLHANFHTALDARYAASGGVLYAAFIHPLSPLSAAELESGVRQVAELARTFGTSYSSGGLVYGGGQAL